MRFNFKSLFLLIPLSMTPLAVRAEPPLRPLMVQEYSPKTKPGFQVIDSLSALQQFWKPMKQAQRPDINFRTHLLVAVWAGEQPTTGYHIHMTPEQTKQGVVLQSRLQAPEKNAIVAQVQTQPMALYLLKKSAFRGPFKLNWVKGSQNTTTLHFKTLSKVSNSLILKKRYVVARDAESFRQLWAQHTGRLDTLPHVNFDQFMVLGVFMGEKPTGGFGVTIEEVALQNGKLKVKVQETLPDPNSLTIQMLTAPAQVILLPRTEAVLEIVGAKVSPQS